MKVVKRVICFGILSVLFISCYKSLYNKKTISGYSFGTSFLIQFEDTNNNEILLKNKIDSLFKIINNSFSTYMSDSDISKINLGDTLIVIDDHFKKVFLKSYDIWKLSKGYFDPTVGSMVNAYGFGPEKKIKIFHKKN